jgi:hypothetical protein
MKTDKEYWYYRGNQVSRGLDLSGAYTHPDAICQECWMDMLIDTERDLFADLVENMKHFKKGAWDYFYEREN